VSYSNDDGDKKKKQQSRFLVHFFTVTARLRREIA